jgi:hypothetical protein
MSVSEGRFEGNTSFPDMQFFIGFDDFQDTSAHAVYASQGAGLISQTLAQSLVCTLFANVGPYLRTGVYATTAYDQEQYGTAASVPGPSAVANTSGPLATLPVYSPIVAASMATLGGIQRGPIPKGIQFDSVDVIYTVVGAALSAATIGLTNTVFANNVAPVVSNLITLGANGLPTLTQAQPYVKNVAVTTPAMIVTPDSEVVLNLNFTTQGSGSLLIYGVVFHCHYNFN